MEISSPFLSTKRGIFLLPEKRKGSREDRRKQKKGEVKKGARRDEFL
jgi:hypothetical protein